MQGKRVTCELHDNYFRSMTIKHAIPRAAEETHPDGQLWGDIQWAIELLYNSVKTGCQLVWRSESLVKRCGRESQHPRASGWAALENEKDTTLMAIRVGVNILQSLLGLQLSHTQTFQIKWEVYFSKRLCRSSLLCRRYDSACICRCICIMSLYSLIMVMAIQHWYLSIFSPSVISAIRSAWWQVLFDV